MEQRPLRLGDIVDDYCPRERRITNHAIVVMSGDDIQQTRCAACDAEHPYKHAHARLKKKRDENGALYDEVLAGVLKPRHLPQAAEPGTSEAQEAQAVSDTPDAQPSQDVTSAPEGQDTAEATAEPEPVAAAWGQRQLIRAQLPRIEGQAPVLPRPIPEFTIRQQGARGYGQANHFNGSRRGPGQGGSNQYHGNGNGHGRGGRDQGGRSPGRSRNSR